MSRLREFFGKLIPKRYRGDKDPDTSSMTGFTGVSRFKDLTRSILSPIGDRTRRTSLRESMSKLISRDSVSKLIDAKKLPSSLEPAVVAEWMQQRLQSRGADFYLILVTILISTFVLADSIAFRVARFIPEPPAIRANRGSYGQSRVRALEEYNVIATRNLFNSKGLIPGEDQGPQDLGGAPVRTTLPLNLIGTLVLRDELKSIATIEDKSASMVYPVRVEDEIPSKLKVVAIEPYRVIFINSATGRREFIDMPEDASANAPRLSVGRPTARAASPGIEQLSPTQFNISRSEVDKALANFNKVLTEARAVPNFENGLPAGYKLFQIVPGSIYEKLGFQNGDTINAVNGQSINDPAKALELLNEFKTASNIQIGIKRDGKQQTFEYEIR